MGGTGISAQGPRLYPFWMPWEDLGIDDPLARENDELASYDVDEERPRQGRRFGLDQDIEWYQADDRFLED